MNSHRWDLLAPHVRNVQDLLDRRDADARVTHLVDQENAYLRESLDDYGLCLADEPTLFAGLALVQVFMHRLERHATSARVAHVVVPLAGAVRNGIIAASLHHIPGQARR